VRGSCIGGRRYLGIIGWRFGRSPITPGGGTSREREEGGGTDEEEDWGGV